MKQKNNSNYTFYKILIPVLLLVALLFGMDRFGIVNFSDFFDGLFGNGASQHIQAPAANIANEPDSAEYYEAIPRDEYALALSKMHFPDEYYRNYKIAISSAENIYVTEYYAIKNHGDWWVQTSNEGIILQTVTCKDGSVTITDNAANSSVSTSEYSKNSPAGVSFEEKCGILSLRSLVNIIKAVASGEPVSHGGGIADYSLSFTQTKLSGENLFSFSFTCQNGVKEEYTFSFEDAVILSASKSYDGKEFYKMEIKDYRNKLDEIDVNSLFR